jgi:hypothetical protein
MATMNTRRHEEENEALLPGYRESGGDATLDLSEDDAGMPAAWKSSVLSEESGSILIREAV